MERNKYVHTYEEISLDRLNDDCEGAYPAHYKDAVPVGTIQFVDRWLKIFKGIKHQYPIEIPTVLRTEKFLKRRYSIVDKNGVPTTGRYFIKDASELKVFSYSGDMEMFMYDGIWDKPSSEFDASLRLDPTHLYQVSEIVDIKAEYRIYIIDGNVEVIAHYNGDVTIFPDMDLINEANELYSKENDYPKSYSMDVMITEKGTSIVEIHNFNSLGLYSTLFGDNLLYAYRDSIDYVVNFNTELIKAEETMC